MRGNEKTLLKNNESQISTNYEVFRQKIIRKAGRSKSLFKAHSFSFISINAFLAFLNFVTPGSYPWFLFPLGSTAMLLSLHYVSKNDRIRQKTDIGKCCSNGSYNCGGCAYGLGFIGAAVYYISTATGFWVGVLGVLKAIVWPVFVVYKLLGL